MRYKFMRFPEGKAKAVTLSYDDGVIEDKRFSDRITEAGLKCTFNLNCDVLRPQALSEDDAREYYFSRGHEVAVHGEMHRAEGTMRPIEGIRDVLNCRLELEAKFGRIIRGMAYPDSGVTRLSYGVTYEKIKSYLTELDIAYARTLGGDNNSFKMPEDWHCWMPSAHHSNPEVLGLIDEFIALDIPNMWAANKDPRLFYLWGHSYEFERNNNWELLDEICDRLGGHDDIWYATNMEIYEYAKAYEALVYSADGKMIYNPCTIDVWINVDGTTYKIKSGETLKI